MHIQFLKGDPGIKDRNTTQGRILFWSRISVVWRDLRAKSVLLHIRALHIVNDKNSRCDWQSSCQLVTRISFTSSFWIYVASWVTEYDFRNTPSHCYLNRNTSDPLLRLGCISGCVSFSSSVTTGLRIGHEIWVPVYSFFRPGSLSRYVNHQPAYLSIRLFEDTVLDTNCKHVTRKFT